MIRYLTHTEIDQAKWDLCLSQSVQSLVYGYSWYLNIVSPNWGALILDDYLAVMPLTAHRKYFIHYLSQPFFTQQLGVFSRRKVEVDLLMQFLQAIPAHIQYIDIQLNENNPVPEDSNHFTKRKNYLLNLDRSYEKIQKGYNSQAKRNLKQARKNNLNIKSISPREVVDYYKNHKAISTKGVRERDYQTLVSLMEKAQQNRSILCKGIFTPEGECLATGAFLLHRNRLIFLIGNGSEKGRDLGAMTYLMDHLIFHFAQTQMMLDFEGSDIEGIARFFKSFGAEKQNYYRYKQNLLPFYLRLLKQ